MILILSAIISVSPFYDANFVALPMSSMSIFSNPAGNDNQQRVEVLFAYHPDQMTTAFSLGNLGIGMMKVDDTTYYEVASGIKVTDVFSTGYAYQFDLSDHHISNHTLGLICRPYQFLSLGCKTTVGKLNHIFGSFSVKPFREYFTLSFDIEYGGIDSVFKYYYGGVIQPLRGLKTSFYADDHFNWHTGLELTSRFFKLAGTYSSYDKKLSGGIVFGIAFSTQTYGTILPESKNVNESMIAETQDLTSIAETFVDLFVMEDFTMAVQNFDKTMKDAAPPNKLKEIWRASISQVGSFKKKIGTRREKYQQYDYVYVTCEFEKLTLDIKVVFSGVKIIGFFFEPAQPSSKGSQLEDEKKGSFQEREVLVGAKDWPLPGTLTLPQGKGPFPAVVLVPGSGPHDRDETIGPNKPFQDLAWGLASRGIAVLRYEKRTKEHRSKIVSMLDSITVKEETIDDVLAALSLLRNTKEIDEKMIFILGHSLGGMLAPRIASLDTNITGLIIMAGATRPLEEVILEQTSYIFSLDDTVSEFEKEQLEILKKQVVNAKQLSLSNLMPAQDLPFGLPAKYWLDLREYRPAELAKNLNQPILILQGERDYQVTPQDFQNWQQSLTDKKNVEFKIYPKLNHLFIEGEGKSTPDEYNIAGHVSETVINDIADWIKKWR